MENKTPSTVGKLNIHDLLNGIIMAIGAPLLTYLQTEIPNYNLPTWVQFAIGTLITYLLKNVFTNNVKVAQKVLIKATKNAETWEQEKAIIHPVLDAASSPEIEKK